MNAAQGSFKSFEVCVSTFVCRDRFRKNFNNGMGEHNLLNFLCFWDSLDLELLQKLSKERAKHGLRHSR